MAVRKKAEHLKPHDFKLKGDKPLGKKPLAVRVPEDMDSALRRVAGNDVSAWVREAIAEKLAREICQQEAS